MKRLWPLLLVLFSCSRGDDSRFPAGFLFGTAIAGFQVDMGCPTAPAEECEDRASDWYAWITRPELKDDPNTHLAGTPPSGGPGFYELYRADFDRAKNELHSNALRLSIEWSRIFPVSTVGVADLRTVASPSGLAYYHALFAALKERGLQPLVTLNHYTLPAWLHDAAGCHKDLAACTARGWLSPDAVREAARYAGFVAAEFRDDVHLWATLNEPFTAVVLAGYLLPSADRTNPPGVSFRWAEAKQVYAALVEAHARMVDAVRAAAPGAQVGIVYNVQAVTARSAQPRDVQAAKDLSYLMNEMFLNAVARGDFDAHLDGQTVHRDDLAGRLDFIGVNYYVRAVVEGLGSSLFPDQSPYMTFNPTSLELRADPKGIGEALDFAARYGKPLYVSETGFEDPADTGAAADWIRTTLKETRSAMTRGADVRGYFYWTLMDNYEWNHGMTMKLGLYGVDPSDPSKARTPRASAIAALREAAETGAVPR